MEEVLDSGTQMLYDIVDRLINSEDWPQIIGDKGHEIYISNLEKATMQVESYWAYVFEEKSSAEIADDLKITTPAAWKRIEKIRNWISIDIAGGYRWDHRLTAYEQFVAFGMPKKTAMRSMTLNFQTLRNFQRRDRPQS